MDWVRRSYVLSIVDWP